MDAIPTWWSGKEGRVDKRPEGKEGASPPDICGKTNQREQVAHNPLEDIRVSGAQQSEERGDVRGSVGPGLMG